ncbi:MAG: hypothetical protein QOJ16_1745 [Acidobacteriota bacterium]|nr:hypothetical protein [Acidobacteriota bacterium]
MKKPAPRALSYLLLVLLAWGAAPALGRAQTPPPPPPPTTTPSEPAATPQTPPGSPVPPGSPAQPAPPKPAQTPPPAPTPAPVAPAPGTAGQPGTPDQATPEDQGPRQPRDRFLPRLDVFFPEGDLDLRVNRLVNKVFFEGQVKYNFINGDITAFLRYRYYGLYRITQLAFFDSISFSNVQKFSNGDFDRVRGTLVFLQWPHDYTHRTFALFEVDRISSNQLEKQFNNSKTNNYIRLGYQVGTPEDSRSNAIVGESRARTTQLFTAAREIGPGGFGFTGAFTYGFSFLNGDFKYVKLEAETLKRFDVSENTFLVARAHLGSIPYRQTLRTAPTVDPVDRYSIPRTEFFSLDGRENLKGLKDKRPGSEEFHTTFEYFFPWFLDAHHDVLRLQWQTWYWILYSGYGTAGFDRSVYRDFRTWVPDVGIGFESTFGLRGRYRFFFSGVVARALKGSGGVEARVSVKSYR